MEASHTLRPTVRESSRRTLATSSSSASSSLSGDKSTRRRFDGGEGLPRLADGLPRLPFGLARLADGLLGEMRVVLDEAMDVGRGEPTRRDGEVDARSGAAGLTLKGALLPGRGREASSVPAWGSLLWTNDVLICHVAWE